MIHSVELGTRDGDPVVILHGAGVDHRELQGALEDEHVLDGFRRIYVDLPGMGETPADGIDSNDDVVEALIGFLEDRPGDDPVRIIGHSYGAYLAQAIATRRPYLVRALALICPAGSGAEGATAEIVEDDPDAYGELDPAAHDGFRDYFVLRTSETARRYRDRVLPGAATVDESALERIFANWALDIDPSRFPRPVALIAGRRDATVGFAHSERLARQYPDARLLVVDQAGHALPHEQPGALAAELATWLQR